MSNSIALFKQYTTILDEKLRLETTSSVLDGAPELARAGANANELIIQKIDVDGLGDYDRNGGYTSGSMSLTNETVQTNFDRGRSFNVDAMDDAETAGMAAGRLMGVFIKDKVGPELDAFRYSKYSNVEGISVATGTLATGNDVIAAIRAAKTKMDEDEVPQDSRYLFITPTIKGLADDIDLTKSRAALEGWNIVTVPQTRFYTAITQLDGKTEGQKAGGYVKAVGAGEATFTGDASKKAFVISDKPNVLDAVTVDGTANTNYTYDNVTGTITFKTAPGASKAVVVKYGNGHKINFLAVHKDAAIQFQKHLDLKVIAPENNPNGDSWIFGYRNVGVCDAYENKAAGIYLHADVE